jgi:hypothetical protein
MTAERNQEVSYFVKEVVVCCSKILDSEFPALEERIATIAALLHTTTGTSAMIRLATARNVSL